MEEQEPAPTHGGLKWALAHIENAPSRCANPEDCQDCVTAKNVLATRGKVNIATDETRIKVMTLDEVPSIPPRQVQIGAPTMTIEGAALIITEMLDRGLLTDALLNTFVGAVQDPRWNDKQMEAIRIFEKVKPADRKIYLITLPSRG